MFFWEAVDHSMMVGAQEEQIPVGDPFSLGEARVRPRTGIATCFDVSYFADDGGRVPIGTLLDTFDSATRKAALAQGACPQ